MYITIVQCTLVALRQPQVLWILGLGRAQALHIDLQSAVGAVGQRRGEGVAGEHGARRVCRA